MNQNLDEKEQSETTTLPNSKPSKLAVKGLIGADGRTRRYKRYSALLKSLDTQSNLKPGPGKSALVTQAAALSLAYESLTAELVNGKPKADALVRVSNSLNRILGALGIVSWIDSPTGSDANKPSLDKLRDPKTWRQDR